MSKVAELLKQREEIDKKLKIARMRDSVAERKERARKLIELGSFFFGLDFSAIHKLIEEKDKPSPIAVELQKKLADYLRSKSIISEKDGEKSDKTNI